ncbi:MAG TPA: FAD-dependent oxidoreductase [Gammaproteobacteria bacterium]|nr:FAD-dependent oxidoreductase [Gammaproteobacteria bacterium]
MAAGKEPDNARRKARSLPQPDTHVPVAYDADVVVVGAGPGGWAAALQAARMGASVIVLEKCNAPGGVHTSGLQGSADTGIGGIHTELMQRLSGEGLIYVANAETHPDWAGNPLTHYERFKKPGSDFTRMTFNPEGAGCVMTDMLHEAGVRALYGSRFVDCIIDSSATGDDRIEAVIVENVSGRQAIAGRIFIEGSGTGELVARSGAPFVRGGGGQPETADWDGVERPIPGGLLWTLTGVDFQSLARHQRDAKDPLLEKTIAEARAAGDLPEGVYRPRMGGKGVYGDFYIGHPTLDMSPIATDGTYVLWQNAPYELALHMDDDADDQARATRLLRSYINAEAKFLKKYVPGFERSSIGSVGRFIGVRDGRHPLGEYLFSIDDARNGRRFPDAVTQPMSKVFFWDSYTRYEFEVPFRSFLPKKIGNMILTGASLSFTYDSIFMVMRNFPWCTQTGEIAGYAAARCIQKKIKPKELNWAKPYF